MEEGVVRMCAEMYIIVARMEALKFRVMAMQAANHQRREQGYADAYGDDSFFAAEDEMLQISHDFTGI